MIYCIDPCPAPRMTRSDRWKKRPCVLKYLEFKDECRRLNIKVDNYDHITFGIKIPKSFSRKKQKEMVEKPHQKRPDCDNLLKALLDSVYKEDSHIHALTINKVWSEHGYIEIRSNTNES